MRVISAMEICGVARRYFSQSENPSFSLAYWREGSISEYIYLEEKKNCNEEKKNMLSKKGNEIS